MTSLSLYFKSWLLALSMLILAAGTAAAQQPDSLRGEQPERPELHSFKIKDGVVSIDGRKIPPEKLPEGFPPEGASVYYMFSPGLDKDLIVEVEGGPRYILEGDSLWATTSRSFSCTMQRYGCKDMKEDAYVLFIPATRPWDILLQQKAEDLREQAKRIQDLQHRFEKSRIGELRQMAEDMTLHAAEAARTASELPHIQMQRYFSNMQHKNKGLFNQLMSERFMEKEVLGMAQKFVEMQEGKARRDSIAVLRERLAEIFELKQENRRREVEELKERLRELQWAIGERQRLQRDIVDRRLQELLGNDTLDW